MNWKRVCDGRRAQSSKALKMGVNESKQTSSPSYNLRARPAPTRTTIRAPEKVPVWPKNSARWQKPYDVYICSSEKDIFYAKALLSYLQGQPEILRCFLPMRDMNPGGAIPTEMTAGAENSHCWIMLLTSASLSDQWCQYQMHQFLAMAPHGNGRLIPVLVELPFEHYPKELRHMYSFRDAQGDQKIFEQLRKTIVSHLLQLPSVTTDQNLKEEMNSSISESGPSSSVLGISSQATNMQTLESTSNSSLKSSETQGPIDDTSLRSSMTQGSTNITQTRSDINYESSGDTSLSLLIQDPASTSEFTSNKSTGSATSNTSVKCPVNQGATSHKPSYTQASTSMTSVRGSLNQESINTVPVSTSITQDFTSDMPLTSPVTQVSTCDTLMGSPGKQESTSETYLRSCSPEPNMNLSLMNYEKMVSNTSTLALSCKTINFSTSARIFDGQEYVPTRKVDSGSSKKEETMDIYCQNFEHDIYTSSVRSLTRNNIQSSCGRVQVDKEILQGDTNISCGGIRAQMNDSLDLQKDLYTSCRPKAESKAFQSLQTNIYTSCGGAKAENTCGKSQAGQRNRLSLLSNIYTSSGRSEDVQSFKKDRYINCGEIEATKEESDILLEDLCAGCGGMQTENEDYPSYQSDIYNSYDGKQALVDSQSFQTVTYISSKWNQRAKKPSCSFQSDLYTSCRGTQAELKNVQTLQREIDTSFWGLQSFNKLSASIKSDIYTSPDGTLPLTGTQTENKDSFNSSSDLYASCTSPKALGSDSCICHGNVYINSSSTQAVKPTINTYRDDNGRPASEAADKT